jgi:SAM-dependent methyltransferase
MAVGKDGKRASGSFDAALEIRSGAGVRDHDSSSSCSLCDSRDLFVFSERTGVPVHQNVPLDTAGAARAASRGDLRLACCRACGFVTNLAFRQDLLHYGAGYENDQTQSPAFEAYTDGLIASLIAAGCRNRFVLEVGSGQGQFLRRLCANGGNRGVGFDPAYTGKDSVDGDGVTFVRELYSGQRTHESPDLVLCRHVLEHVPDPMRFLKDIVRSLGRDRSARIAFEMRTVGWVLEQVMVHDFFYEHCSYFTAESVRFAFERAGFTNVVPTATFGGQYLWVTADYQPASPRPMPRLAPGGIVKSVERYVQQEQASGAALRAKIEKLRVSGPVAIWGAGAKGVTLLNLIDPGCQIVDCTVDVNPKKQGKFIPGTGHPIVSPAELPARDVRGVLVMNPNYADEVRHALHAISPDVVVGA